MLSIAERILTSLWSYSTWSEEPVDSAGNKVLLQKVLFAANGHIPKLGNPILSGHSIGSMFTVSDYTFAYRSIIDLCNSLGVGGWFHQIFGGTDASLVYQASGFSSALGVFVGAVQMQRAFENLAVSEAISDKRGALIGRVDVLKNGAYIGGALGLSGFRAFSIFDSVKGIAPSPSSASLVGRATYGVLIVGLVLYAVFFALLGVITGVKVYEGKKFTKKLEGQSLQEQIAILKRQMNGDPMAIFEKLKTKMGEEGARQKLIDTALSSGKEQLRALLKELNIPEVTDEKLSEIVKGVVDDPEQLMEIGLILLTQSVQAKKLAKLGRILNKEGLEALKTLASLNEEELLTKGAELIDKIQNGAKKKLIEHGVLIGIFIFGVITLIAAMVFSGGLGLVVAAVLMLVFTILSIGLDGYYLVQSYKEEAPAAHDKKMLLISSIVAVASFLIIAALVASGVVSMGTIPLVAGLIVLLIWLAQNGITWAVMNRNERRFNEKNPTLQILIDALREERDEGRLKRIMENLPPEIKKEFEETLTRQEKLGMALALSHKVEEAKKERIEELRKALAPLLVR
ncbi:MAG: hypothetical protein JSS30_07140 [Verrucomicrobia bacterium]|nr:hypothetical protein [Verrucomicrobiota bacterium]